MVQEKKCRKEYYKQFYLKNREELLERSNNRNTKLKIKIECECGSKFRTDNLKLHKLTELHKRKLDRKNKLVVDKDQHILDVLNDLKL